MCTCMYVHFGATADRNLAIPVTFAIGFGLYYKVQAAMYAYIFLMTVIMCICTLYCHVV